jgi:hypothetical protein
MANNTLDLTSLGPLLEDDVNTIVRRLGLGVLVRNVKSSPVDTGRFQSNWVISIDAESAYTDDSEYSGATKGSVPPKVLNKASSELSGFNVMRNSRLYLQNNLDYAEKLADGSSTQAPAGWIDMNVRNELKALESALGT